jgi:uncharacterized membrane protein
MGGVSETNPAPAVGPDHDEVLAPAPGAAAPGALQARLARLEKLWGADRLGELPAWLRRTSGEHRLPVGLAIVALISLQVKVPASLAFKPWYLLPAIEAALFIVLTIASPWRLNRESKLLRAIGLGLVTVASVATLWSAARLAYGLIRGTTAADNAIELLLNAGAVWLTNVIVFALWYWEFDRGGPAARANARKPYPDFLFPQMTSPELAPPDWEPTFVDYLYLSFTNTTAFSPTDVMPLSRWAKLAMFVQSGVSLVLVALVVARAVNILS